MGPHKKPNLRSRGTGALTEGDRLAEDVHGRKGMNKERRENGSGFTPIENEMESLTISKDDIVLLKILHFTPAYDYNSSVNVEKLKVARPNIHEHDWPSFYLNFKKKFSKWIREHNKPTKEGNKPHLFLDISRRTDIADFLKKGKQ